MRGDVKGAPFAKGQEAGVEHVAIFGYILKMVRVLSTRQRTNAAITSTNKERC